MSFYMEPEDIMKLEIEDEDVFDEVITELDGNQLLDIVQTLYIQYRGDDLFEYRLKEALVSATDFAGMPPEITTLFTKE